MRLVLPVLAFTLALPAIPLAQDHRIAPPFAAAAPSGRSEAARARHPQPIRVGDLSGRQVLEDVAEQRVLGRVAGVARGHDGSLGILMDHGGWFGFGTRRILVPVEATALLGQFLVVKDLNRAQLAASPDAAVPPGNLLPADATIRIGLTRN